jgi:hypothetical protein
VSVRLPIALGLALLSAIALNAGFYVQHEAATGLPQLSLRRPVRSLIVLFGNRRWLSGFVTGIGGWALYVAALALGSLSLVQAASAGGVGILALLARTRGRVELQRAEWLGVVICVAGLGLLGLSLLGAGHGGLHRAPPVPEIALWIDASAVLAAGAAGPLAARLASGAGMGVAAGLMYAAGDVATKTATGGGRALVFVPVLLACHGLGFVCLQLGFQRGGVLATAGVSTVLTNALPIAAAVALFHDPVPRGILGGLRVLAFAAVVTGGALLSSRQGEVEPPASTDMLPGSAEGPTAAPSAA